MPEQDEGPPRQEAVPESSPLPEELTSCSDAAAAYASRGWRVFPLKPRSKEPLIKWKDGATTDHDTIRTWWANWPDANVGIVTGAASGIVVGDVDHVERFKVLGLELSTTLTAHTGRERGVHHYFLYPGVPVPNSSRNGFDVRGDGGYVVAPPSLHRVVDWCTDRAFHGTLHPALTIRRLRFLLVQGTGPGKPHGDPFWPLI